MGEWNFGDGGERDRPLDAGPVDGADGSGFWAPGASRAGKFLASVLMLLVATFVAWHGYEILLGLIRLFG